MSRIFFEDTYIAVIPTYLKNEEHKHSMLHVFVKVVCTGHSGIWDYTPKIFAHIDESAKSTAGHPFDPTAPKSIRK